MDVAYAIHLEPAFTGGYFVTCRDLPALLVAGDGVEDTVRRASEALDLLLTILIDEDVTPPLPTPLRTAEVWIQPSEPVRRQLRYYFSSPR